MCRRAMRDPSAVEAKLVALVRELSRRAGRAASEDEARAALAPLSAKEEQALLHYAQSEPPARPLGPMAWADLARGTSAQTAAAREMTGYYEMQIERDALAQMLRGKESAGESSHAERRPARSEQRSQPQAALRAERRAAPKSAPQTVAEGDNAPAPREVNLAVRKVEPKPVPRRTKKGPSGDEERAGQLLTLFAYHRDTALVAKALSWSLDELNDEVNRLHLRRQTGKLLRGLDTEMPIATPRKSASSEPVRRRSAKEREETAARKAADEALAALAAAQKASEPAEASPRSKRIPGTSLPRASARVALEARAPELPAARKNEPRTPLPRAPTAPSAAQADELRAVLREIGPRRAALAARLGTPGHPLSPAALLARFRAAGLEREFGQRERDLVRALVSRHRGALKLAATELGVSKHGLEQLIAERGLAREVEELRERQRTSARAARWPKAALAQLLDKRDWLADLGLLDELQADARARVQLHWSDLPESDMARRIEALAGKLGLRVNEAHALAAHLSLR